MSNIITNVNRVAVGLGERSYDILIGDDILAHCHQWIAPHLRHNKTIVITDDHVAPHHLQGVTKSLQEGGVHVDSIIVPAGEKSKCTAVFSDVCEQVLSLGIDRTSTLVALGGGVIGDLVGYVAASLLRGIDFIQIPTTLLAQVDSSVGGKTGINAQAGKNLIGAFHQPKLVLIDVATLNTLPVREVRAGYAEILKYGAIDDFPFFEWLEKNGQDVIDGNNDARRYAVMTSVQAKSRVVSADEKEGGIRALLNLGHTFAHALENTTHYDGRLLHGEAVAIGMKMAHDLSVRMGLCPTQDSARLTAHLKQMGLPTDLSGVPSVEWHTQELIDRMWKDKKVVGGTMTFILSNGMGQAFISRDVNLDDVRAVLDTYTKNETNSNI